MPVSVSYFPSPSTCKTKQWRLSNSLLRKDDFGELIESRITEFFLTSIYKSVSFVTTVFSHVGFGMISYASAGKRETYGKKVKLSNKRKTLEEQHMFQPSNFDLKTSTTQKRFWIRRQSSKNAYLQTETSIQNRLLMLVQACFTLTISPLTQHSNRFTPTSMNLNSMDVNRFLTGFLSLYAQDKAELEAPLTQSEIQLAITKLALHKSPMRMVSAWSFTNALIKSSHQFS